MLKCYSIIPEALFRQDDMFNVNCKSVDDDTKTMWSSVAKIQTKRFSTKKKKRKEKKKEKRGQIMTWK